MKQHLVTIESANASKYEREVNELLEEGYLISSTHIRGVEVGSYDEDSVYQAILVKESEEVRTNERVKIEASFRNISDEELEKLTKADA